MMSNRARRDIDWKALENTPTLAWETIGLNVSTPTILVSSSTPVPRCSERIVIVPDRFMYLRDSFQTISEEHEIDPTNYDEAMGSHDAIIW